MPEHKNDDSTVGEVLAIMGRFFAFDPERFPYAGTTLVIKEMQNVSHSGNDGGTGLNVWDGAVLIARYLEKRPEIVMNKKVLELGAGCGLVGIAASKLGAKEVVMTDLQYALPLMRENVEQNKSSEDHQNISCQECDWFSPPTLNQLFQSSNDGKSEMYPDVIIVADCVWLYPLVAPLLRTLKAYSSNPSTTVLISYQQRGRDVHDSFWTGVHDMFDEVEDVDTEKTAGLAKPDVFHVLECRRRTIAKA
ncbi:hypothetical protein HJC23_007272 [Cyclotella cryptica]|uniref:Calmodulin-lysine N-methyltransferase n=1 Tax=Cyclotella cryptica TaxID=29204 RepID=A0ABD3Q0H2_9STRA|eukprot:CCRYP_010064-RA/>CCRYP_010064-RA protein AED:0.34 eAED:0.34 QI:221/1/1/1/0.75/0.6/5/1568/248